MRLHLLAISAGLFLGACQTVQDQSIPLHQEFKNHAEQFVLQRPTWRLSDTAYQQSLQSQHHRYEISGTKTGWGKSEQSQLWFSQSGFLLEGLEIQDKFLRFVFLDLLAMRKKDKRRYLLKSENDFAFKLNSDRDDAVHVRCRTLSMNDQLETSFQSDSKKSQTSTKTTRLSSYLGCELQGTHQRWYFTVQTTPGETPIFHLRKDDQVIDPPLQLTRINMSSHLINGEWRDVPNHFRHFSGLTITHENKTIAAHSFNGQHPKVWIAEQLIASEKTMFMALSYSLMMYDWIDGSWRAAF